MKYIESDFIPGYWVEESDELYSIEDSKFIRGLGKFFMGFGAFGAVFFMNTEKAVAIKQGFTSQMPQAVKDRGKQYVKNKVHTLPQEINYRLNAILIENAFMKIHDDFYQELKRKSLAELEVQLKVQLQIQSTNQLLLQNTANDGYFRLLNAKISLLNSQKVKTNKAFSIVQEKYKEELIRDLVKSQMNSYLRTFYRYLSYGAGLTVSSLILYQIIQMVRNKQKRKKVLDALIQLRGGAVWNRLKHVLVNSFTSENPKDSNCNGEKRSIQIGKVMFSQEGAVGMIIVLLKLLEKRRIAGIREKNSIDVAYDSFFPKPIILQRIKNFLPQLNYRTPLPYLIILVGVIVIYYSVIVSSEQKRALFKHLKDQLHENLTSLLYSLDSFIDLLNYYLEDLEADDAYDKEIEFLNFLIARLQANMEKEEAKLRLLYKALNFDKDFNKIEKKKKSR